MNHSEFVIDTNILEYASCVEPEKREKQVQESVDFVRAFVACESMHIALDDREKCRADYNRIMKDDDKWGQKVLAELQAAGRVTIYVTKPIKVTHKSAFLELSGKVHFDRGDYMFVETAIASTAKRIVTEDKRSYSARAQKVLKRRLGLHVYRARPATDLIPAIADIPVEPTVHTEPEGQDSCPTES